MLLQTVHIILFRYSDSDHLSMHYSIASKSQLLYFLISPYGKTGSLGSNNSAAAESVHMLPAIFIFYWCCLHQAHYLQCACYVHCIIFQNDQSFRHHDLCTIWAMSAIRCLHKVNTHRNTINGICTAGWCNAHNIISLIWL